MPTSPVITPISWRKRCGTSWKTEPLPIPNANMATTNSANAVVGAFGPEADDDEHQRRDAVHDRQRTDAADAIRQRAAHGPHQRAREHTAGGEIPGVTALRPYSVLK